MKLAALVAYGKDNIDKATIGFTLINAALDAGHKVRVALPSEGVRLTIKGYSDDIDNGEPFKPLKQLLQDTLDKGVVLTSHAQLRKNHNHEEHEVHEGDLIKTKESNF